MRSLKLLLFLCSIEAPLAAFWTFITPSERGSAVWLWLSRERILLFGLTFIASSVIVAVTIWLWRSGPSLESAQSRLDQFSLSQKRLVPLLIYVLVLPILILVATLKISLTPVEYSAYRSWAPDTFPLLHSLVSAALPLLLLAALIGLEFAAYLIFQYRHAFADRGFWSWRRIAPSALVLLIGSLTVFYWLVLVFQLRFFVSNPAWYWKFEQVPLNPGDLVFTLLAISLLAISYWSLILRRQILPGLLLLVVLGLVLQFGVGLMAGGGFASFQDRYFSSYHKTYIAKATTGQITLVDSIRRYEALYGGRTFTNTKPPGLMAYYLGLDHLINGFPSAYPDNVRYERLSNTLAYAFPILAMLMVFALYAFAYHYVQGQLGLVSILAPFLLVLCPNFILFSLFADQAIYPLVFLLGIACIIVVVRQRSVIWAFLLGLLLYLAAFFAFTMLPLYPFAALYLALNYWTHRRDVSLKAHIWMALATAAGTLLLYFAFRTFLDYDFVRRFGQAVSINHNFDFYLRVGSTPPAAPESVLTRIAQTIGAAWLNHLDFAAAMGFPLYILFLVGAIRLLARLVKGEQGPGDNILAALLLSFIVLNVAGTAQGEVPRLWLFWLPMMLIFAAIELEPYVEFSRVSCSASGFPSFITLFLIFHFQDLRM